MKQLQFEYTDDERFEKELRKISQWQKSNLCSMVLFQIFTAVLDEGKIRRLCQKIEEALPEALYAGCSSFGNILEGDFSGPGITLTCTFFEYATTRVALLQYPLCAETQARVAEELRREVAETPWVKGIELLTTIRGMSMTTLCEGLSALKEDIQIFGGGAFCGDINGNDACVFSKAGGYMENGIVFVLLGGEDFHLETNFLTGWKPLGSYLNVTAADGCILKELNHRSAYETYYKYLHIQNDKDFFVHTLEFPFFYHYHGIDIMRAPVSSNPDGSLVMTSDIAPNVMARIAYGDPWTILDETMEEGRRLLKFSPECIFVFSCAGRRTFWGDREVGKETAAYQMVAPTSGFYTMGEFLRTGKYLNQHNVTQVLAAMREGEPRRRSETELIQPAREFRGRVSIINRMATFVKTATEELEEANRRLAAAAVTDGLTGLYNRTEIQRRVTEAIDEEKRENLYLIMLDLDFFKRVNDVYGHKAGDDVLKGASGVLKEGAGILGEGATVGRWGGEEFMVLLPAEDPAEVRRLAERIRRAISELVFDRVGSVTASLGVVKVRAGEEADKACIRVDEALYDAKGSGRNRVVFHES